MGKTESIRRWGALAVVSAFATAIAFAGCGSSGDGNVDAVDGGDEDVTVGPRPNPDPEGPGFDENDASGGNDGGDPNPNGSDGSVGPGCLLAGTTCASSNECCTGVCDSTLRICVKPVGACKVAGQACSAGNECCTFVCGANGTCGQTRCVSDNQACTSNESCCGGRCDPGTNTCTPLNATCKTAGNACSTGAECCSTLCQGGYCSNQPSFCTQNGDVCSTDAECCGGSCLKASGAKLGVCRTPSVPGSPGCTAAGQVCAGSAADGGVVDAGDGGVAIPACGGECCSRACAPFGPTGVPVCQPPSGCRPAGEICRTDRDCCGAPGLPGGNGSVRCSKNSPSDPVGRCDNGQACRAAGAVCKLATSSCNAENNCCAGNVNQNPAVCVQDLLGIPRCVTTPNACVDAGSKQGQACATSADCCGLPCVPNPVDGGSPFVCGGICVSTGGRCTTHADCCSGLPCVTAPGASGGTCGRVDSEGPFDGGSGDAGIADAGADSAPVEAGPPPCALFGQICTAQGQCCNGVPCTNGRCQYPIR